MADRDCPKCGQKAEYDSFQAKKGKIETLNCEECLIEYARYVGDPEWRVIQKWERSRDEEGQPIIIRAEVK